MVVLLLLKGGKFPEHRTGGGGGSNEATQILQRQAAATEFCPPAHLCSQTAQQMEPGVEGTTQGTGSLFRGSVL